MEVIKSISFKKFLIIYLFFLIALCLIFLGYVYSSLVKYENNQECNFVYNSLEKLKHEDINKYISQEISPSKFDKPNASACNGIKEILNFSNISYKLNENTTDNIKPIYDIYVNDILVFQMQFDGSQQKNALGLLNYSLWKLDKIIVNDGILKYRISVPNKNKILINNIELDDSYLISNNNAMGIADISKYMGNTYIKEYEVSGLIETPEIKILDENGNDVTYNKDNLNISVDLNMQKIENKDEAIPKILNCPDIIKIAESWSLYLTNDLQGNLHGFDNIKNYFIKDSELYKYAYQWATNVDITLTSKHILAKDAFTNENLCNFELYNEKAFSCEVELQKNMILINHKKIEDKMHERFYFAYIDETDDGIENPTWKLVCMKAIVNKSDTKGKTEV